MDEVNVRPCARSLGSLCVYVRASTAGMLTVAIKTSISQTLRPKLSPWFVSAQQKRATASLKQTKQYAQLNFLPSLDLGVFFFVAQGAAVTVSG